MKKFIVSLLLAALLIPLCIIPVFAEDATPDTTASAVASQEKPDWLITEISENQVGDTTVVPQWGTTGFSGCDCFEFIEIYNNSGKTLNLYDYCMTYNGNGRTNADGFFEHQITETTPFLSGNLYEDKAGNYLDGSGIGQEGFKYKYLVNDLEVPLVIDSSLKNPATCEVAANEVVVLWFVYLEAYYSKWHETSEGALDGTGMTMTDFRTFYDIPENVKVICVDAFSTTTLSKFVVKSATGTEYKTATDTEGPGGCDKNFNIKNSET